MEEKVFRSTLEKVENIEKEFGTLENYAKKSTNLDEKHRLKIEDDYSSIFQDLTQVYDDLRELELADLFDFQNLYGRFDGDNDKTW